MKNSIIISIIFFIITAILLAVGGFLYSRNRAAENAITYMYNRINGTVMNETCTIVNINNMDRCRITVSYKINNNDYISTVVLPYESNSYKNGDSIALLVSKTIPTNVEYANESMSSIGIMLMWIGIIPLIISIFFGGYGLMCNCKKK